jgi:hypothetical protein
MQKTRRADTPPSNGRVIHPRIEAGFVGLCEVAEEGRKLCPVNNENCEETARPPGTEVATEA